MSEERMTVEGLEVLVEGEGDETIVMVHGWPDTYRLWDSTVERLKGRYRCVRFTLPGYDVTKPPRAVSMAEMTRLYAAVVDAVSPGKPVIMLMHDWGAIFGYDFVARHQDKVSRIVAVDIGDTSSGAFIKSLSFKAKLMVVGYQLWLALAWKLGGLGDRMSRSMARALRCPTDPVLIGAQMNYPYALLWSGGFKDMARFDPFCPVLYIYGRRKPFMFHSPKWIERINAQPDSEVREMNTGHWVMANDPAGFNDCVEGWLAKPYGKPSA
jgi:cis-3-alkyl-4-acyloxetan-2-one decarboxylase